MRTTERLHKLITYISVQGRLSIWCRLLSEEPWTLGELLPSIQSTTGH